MAVCLMYIQSKKVMFYKYCKYSNHNRFVQKCNFSILFLTLRCAIYDLQYLYQTKQFIPNILFLLPW